MTDLAPNIRQNQLFYIYNQRSRIKVKENMRCDKISLMSVSHHIIFGVLIRVHHLNKSNETHTREPYNIFII
jgi:hypothetical protein